MGCFDQINLFAMSATFAIREATSAIDFAATLRI
jgi:hypothetical protein